MAATSAGQQQHKLNIVANAEAIAGEMQHQQQQHQQAQQQQQQQIQMFKQQQQQQQQQHQFFQQHQTKFVSRVVTNTTTTMQQQQQQQILPAGLVNGNGNIVQAASNLQHQQQQLQQQQQRNSQHVFVCPTSSPQLLLQQQQQQQAKQRQAQIKLPVKSTSAPGTATATATVAPAATQCLPTTIASRQMSQNSHHHHHHHPHQLYAKNVAKANNNNPSRRQNNNNNNSTISYNGNLAPGWRRLTNNNEVAYISPTGKTLRTQYQIKDYLLTQGTCKCGLPCPLRPEYIFDFNAQVPNMPLRMPSEMPASSSSTTSSMASSTPCLHQRRFLESQQQPPPAASAAAALPANIIKDVSEATMEATTMPSPMATAVSDVFSTLMTTRTTAATSATSATPAAAATITATRTTLNTTSFELANKDADCHKYGNNKLPAPSTGATTTTVVPSSQALTAVGGPSAVGIKRSASTNPAPGLGSGSGPGPGPGPGHVIKQPTMTTMTSSTAVLPPPAAPSPAPAAAATPPMQQPNFKDDPAGYLQQQTTLLHNTLGMGMGLDTSKPRSLPQEPIVHSSQQQQQQQQQRQKMRRLSLFSKWEPEASTPGQTPVTGPAPRSHQVDAAFARPQKPQITSVTIVPTAQESPVSSSPPEQVGAISTSHESPRQSLSSPTDSLDSAKSSTPSPSPKLQVQQMHQQQQQQQPQTQLLQMRPQGVNQTTQLRLLRQQNHAMPGQRLPAVVSSNNGANAGAAISRSIVTTTAGALGRPITTTQSTGSSGMAQLQTMAGTLGGTNGGSQLIMTSTGQLLVIPNAAGKHHQAQHPHQHRGGQPHQGNMLIQQQQQAAELHHHPGGGYIVSQPTNGGAAHNGANGGSTSTSSSSSSTVILNSGGAAKLLHHQIITSQAGQIAATAGAAGGAAAAPAQTVLLNTLPNGGYIVQQPQHPQAEQLLAMPQPAAPPPPGQTLIISSPEGKRRTRKRKVSICHTPPPPPPSTTSSSSSPVKTHSPQISPSIPSQAPALLQQAAAAAAAAAVSAPQPTHQFSHQFQLSPGIQGIVVNKPAAQSAPQTQQLLLQNGQILQHVNLIGQQLLMPAGLVMGPDATLLQIQNMPTTSLLTPQGPVMLRTPSPQSHKPSFISPSGGGQQYIVGANGQLSPIGQIYSTPMGLVMPTGHQQGGTSTFVQASPTTTTTIQIQQAQQTAQQAATTQISLQPPPQATTSYVTESLANRQGTAASPPDTTTCSPRSPERPPSHRSSGSDMVQCVSSSEPDAAVSPQSVESRQSPSSTDCERNSIGTTSNLLYKPTEAKIRRIHITSQAPTENGRSLMGQGMRLVNSTSTSMSISSSATLTTTAHRPLMHHHLNTAPATNSHPSAALLHKHKVVSVDYNPESPTTTQQAISDAPAPEARKTGTHIRREPTKRSRRPQRGALARGTANIGGIMLPPRSFAIGELIWGPARGHPAWPGKIVKMPDGVCTPSQQFDHVWVQWFGGGGRSTSELIPVNSLQSLSEGLEAHHKAQKDTRKSRKLNSQLERAIQEAMTELDNISASSSPGVATGATAAVTVTTTAIPSATTATGASVIGGQQQQQQPSSTNSNNAKANGVVRGKRQSGNTSGNGGGGGGGSGGGGASMLLTASTAATLSGLFSQQRAKPIRIAPAPPAATATATATTTTTTAAASGNILPHGKADILKLAK